MKDLLYGEELSVELLRCFYAGLCRFFVQFVHRQVQRAADLFERFKEGDLVFRREAGLGDKNAKITLLRRGAFNGVSHAALEHIAPVKKAGGVDKDGLEPRAVKYSQYVISGGLGFFRNDGQARSAERIHQRGFTGIGQARYGDEARPETPEILRLSGSVNGSGLFPGAVVFGACHLRQTGFPQRGSCVAFSSLRTFMSPVSSCMQTSALKTLVFATRWPPNALPSESENIM